MNLVSFSPVLFAKGRIVGDDRKVLTDFSFRKERPIYPDVCTSIYNRVAHLLRPEEALSTNIQPNGRLLSARRRKKAPAKVRFT